VWTCVYHHYVYVVQQIARSFGTVGFVLYLLGKAPTPYFMSLDIKSVCVVT
jgi:hypothetical protein